MKKTQLITTNYSFVTLKTIDKTKLLPSYYYFIYLIKNK